MTFDPAKPVRTRNGRKARILATDFKGVQPILAAINDGSVEKLVMVGPNGKMYEHSEAIDDLFNIPERKERFINIYDPDLICSACMHTTLEDAVKYEDKSRRKISRLKIVFEGDDLVGVEILEKR